MSSEGSVSTDTSSRIRQFGLYRTIDARTEEFLRLSRKRQIKQGCACAAISTAITVTVVITVFLVYMEYGVNTALNQQTLGKASWILNDTLASTFEEKFSKSKLNFDRTTIKLLPLLIKALKQNRYLEKIIEDYSSSSPPNEGKVTTEYAFKKGLFANNKNWLKKPTSRLFAIEYKTSPIVYYKKPSKNLAYFTKIRKIRDYNRIMQYVNKMISEKAIDHTLPMLSDDYKTETMKPLKRVHKSSKKTVTAHLTTLHDKPQKIFRPSKLKLKSNKLNNIKIVSCKCPKQLSVILNKIVSSIHHLLPDKKNNKTAPCSKQQTKPVTTTASTSTIMTTTTMIPTITTSTTKTFTTTTFTTETSTTTTPTTTTTRPTSTRPTTTRPTTTRPTTSRPTTTCSTTTRPTTTRSTTTRSTTTRSTTTRSTTTRSTTTHPTTTSSTTTRSTTARPTTTRTKTTRPSTSRTTTNLPTTTSNELKPTTRVKFTQPLLYSEFDNIFNKTSIESVIQDNEETTKALEKPKLLEFKNIQPHIKEGTSQHDDFKITTVKQFIEPTEINVKFSSHTQSMTTLSEYENDKEDVVTVLTPKEYIPQYNVKQSPYYNKVDSVPKLKTPENAINNDHNITSSSANVVVEKLSKILGFVHKLTHHINKNDYDIITSTVLPTSSVANNLKIFNMNNYDLFKSDALITSKRLNSTQQLQPTEHLSLANIHTITSEVTDANKPTESYLTGMRVFTPLSIYYKDDYNYFYQNTAIPKIYYESTTPPSRNPSLETTIINDFKKLKSNDERKLHRYHHYFDNLSTTTLVEDEVDKATRDDDYHQEFNGNPLESLTTVAGTKTLTSNIEKEDVWKLLKSNDSGTNFNSMIPMNRPTYLEIYRNGWRVDENDDYDLNMKYNIYDLQ